MPICSSFRLTTNSSPVSSHWVIKALIVWLCRPPRPKPSKSHFNEVERYRWRECFNWSSIGTMHIVHSFLHDELFYLLRAQELFLEFELHDKMHRRKIRVGNYERCSNLKYATPQILLLKNFGTSILGPRPSWVCWFCSSIFSKLEEQEFFIMPVKKYLLKRMQ